jgi:hypothetical protein
MVLIPLTQDNVKRLLKVSDKFHVGHLKKDIHVLHLTYLTKYLPLERPLRWRRRLLHL